MRAAPASVADVCGRHVQTDYERAEAAGRHRRVAAHGADTASEANDSTPMPSSE